MIVILVIAEDELQPWGVRYEGSIDNAGRGTTIVDARGRDEDGEKQAHAVCQDMAFSALDLLAPVVPAGLPAGRRRGNGLAIDYPQTGRRRTACLNAHLLPQGSEDLIPGAILFPLLQVLVDSA